MLYEKDTMFLPGFQWLNKGRKLHFINEEKSLGKMNLAGIMNLPLIFSAVLSRNLILKSLKRSGMRNRIYSDELSFWSFLAQIFLYRCSCKEMVKKIQAEFQVLGRKIPGASDSSYCRARSRLSQKGLEAILGNLSARLDKNKSSQERTIKAIDGTGISMPDTPENQKKYPQNGAMKKGCGFPSMKLAMIFSVQTGALLGYSIGNKKSSERRLALDIFKHVNKGDLLLGDRGFFSYLNFALLMSKGADLLFRYNKIKHFSKGNSNQISYLEKYASDDGLVLWKKPSSNPSQMISDKEWKNLPEELTIRLTKVKLHAKGFRTQEITLAGSLLDPLEYPAEKLAELYFKRWSCEGFIRDMKTTMGMEILRCRTPEMVKKELAVYAIAYNLLRYLVSEAERKIPDSEKISFKESIQQLRQWRIPETLKNSPHGVLNLFCEVLRKSILRQRPMRSEPRAIKRRLKPYNLLTKSRKKMLINYHHNNTKRKNALYVKKTA